MNHLTARWLSGSNLSGESLIDRIMAKVIVDHHGCWLYGGNRTSGGSGPCGDGYGHIATGEKRHGKYIADYVHRIMYRMFSGAIPGGYEIDHLCRVRPCVNPDHLEAVTRRENLIRGNTFAARLSSQILCKRGHSLAPVKNIPNRRYCPTCHRQRARARYYRLHPEARRRLK